MFGTPRGEAAPMLGRSQERDLLESLLDQVATRGRGLVLSGAPGIGKSRLLAEAVHSARERGMTVLTATGVLSEAHLPFAGLHQLLRPVRGRAVELPAVQREALDAVFGLTREPAPEKYRIAMAALDLLAEVATDAPLVVVVEDVQWVDRATVEILGFVVRRIESDPILVLAAIRDGYPSALGEAGLDEQRIDGLDDAAASALLDVSARSLSTAVRSRVLREAEGNPLALLELPAMVGRGESEQSVAGTLPLTERLEHAFASRLPDLPDPTRQLLLVAAISDEGELSEILQAGSLLAGKDLAVADAEPAAEVGIVDVGLHTLRFRHPLIRSAVAQSAGAADRRRAHEALADVLADQPDRSAWHRSALLAGEHEGVARQLEEAAARARRRGASGVAITALRRAADLGEPAGRSQRLLAAAGLAVELGRPEVVEPLLQEVRGLNLDELDRARVTWVEETALTRPLDAAKFASLISAAEQAGAAGHHDLHVDLLWLVASRAWWVDPGPEVRQRLVEASRRLGDASADDPRVFAIYAYADPLGHANEVLDRLRRAAMDGQLDTDAARFFGPAALVVGAFDLGNDFLAEAVAGLRREGRLGHLPRLLTLQSSMAARLGAWEVAMTAAEEATRLASELGEPQWAAAADTAIAIVAAMRGDEEKARLMAARAEMVAEPAQANITVAFAQFGKVLAALATSRHAEAYAYAERLFEPEDSAYHPVISSWLIADLAEAARHIDQLEAARARVARVEAMARGRGAWLEIVLRHARALVAEPAEAGQRFAEALAADLSRWPFQRARIQVAYGQWLRRERRVADSRAVLRAARDTFDALGCAPWGDQARRELRASGERSRRRTPEARDSLTAQELQIAQLAADGLSNREIGQRLFLSHRTISTHLYRTFPKLGVRSRSELSGALAPRPSP